MSPDTDRIAVPTNGHRPHPIAPAGDGAAPAPVADAGEPARLTTVPFTPTQLAVGFGIVAAVVALLAGSLRRRGRARRRGPFGR